MTSTSASGLAQHTDEHTLRDIVVRSPGQVNEVWCRKIFRQLLQALEQQHAAQRPHAAITPDTIGLNGNGDPVLLPFPDATGEPGEAADVQALGAVIHFAITGEAPPAAPLRGRAHEGYSESLVGAVDKCTAADPCERPQTIDQLRKLLGIVSLGPPVTLSPAALAHALSEQPAESGRSAAPPTGWQRWLMIGLAVLVLLAAAAALFALLSGSEPHDTVVLALPTEPPAKTLDPNETLIPAPSAPAATAPATAVSAGAAATGSTATGPAATGPAVRPAAPPLAPAAARPAPAIRGALSAAPQLAPTTYKLLIKPWGTVYVDGAERGVSPPLKRLTLAAGQHTVRIVNPNFRDRVIKVDAGKRQSDRIVHDFASRSR